MTKLPLPLVGGAFHIDNSTLELLTTCPRAMEYSKLHARIAATDKPSLSFGTAIHAALEHRYKIHTNNPPEQQCYEEQVRILEAHYATHTVPVDDWRTLNWACQIIAKYNQIYHYEPFRLLTGPDGTPLVELSFMHHLYDHTCRDGQIIPVFYTGRIDLPVMWDDMVIILDHKTTSMLGTQYFERGTMSAQQRGYCWAFEQSTGKRPNGYCINAIRTKEPPIKIQQGGKPGEVEKWWQESFGRQRFYITEEGIAEWKTNAIALVEEFFWHYENNYMPMKTAWCHQFGRCQYYDVCSLPVKDRPIMLQSSMYMDNTWSPLTKREPVVSA